MSKDQHASNTDASPPAILANFLAASGQTISYESAAHICSTLDISNRSTLAYLKASAKNLRNELALLNISIKHSHALNVLSQISGHSNFAKASHAFSAPKDCYVLNVSVDGESGTSTYWTSFSECASRAADAANRLLDTYENVAICAFTRASNGFQCTVRQGDGLWFTLHALSFADNSLSPNVLSDNILRDAINRFVHNVEQASSRAIVVNGTVCESLSPRYKGVFELRGLRARKTVIAHDELELYQVLDAAGCDEIRYEESRIIIDGINENFIVDAAWEDVTSSGHADVIRDTTQSTAAVFARYLRFRKAINTSIADAFASVPRAGDSPWFAKVDWQIIEKLMAAASMTTEDLLSNIFISSKALRRIQSCGIAAPEYVSAIACLLNVAPGTLLKRQESAASFNTDNIEDFLEIISGATEFIYAPGESLQPSDTSIAQSIADAVKTLADSMPGAQRCEAVSQAVASKHFQRARTMATEILKNSEAHGLILVCARDVGFPPAPDNYDEDEDDEFIDAKYTLCVGIERSEALVDTVAVSTSH